MGIIARFGDIMASNINALLDKMEDPSKMIDQTLRQLNEDLAEVKKETAGVMAEEMRAQKHVDKLKANIAKHDAAARNALMANDEAAATKLLATKQELEAQLVTANNTLSLAQQNAAKMRQMYNKIANDITVLNSRRENIKAQVSMAKAQQRVNKMTAATSAQNAMDKFNRMEAKAQKMLDTAAAEAQLNADMTADTDLLAQYSNGSSVSVNDELMKMKIEMGLMPAPADAPATVVTPVVDDDDDDEVDPLVEQYLQSGNNTTEQ